MQPPKLNLDLTECPNANAFNLLALFRWEAKKAGWTKEQIDKETTQATSSDYAYLLDYLTSL